MGSLEKRGTVPGGARRPAPVVVVAPSRSGTSVVTRVVNLLGAPVAVEDDLYSAPDNPDGHWESQTVIDLNEELLARLHGSWALPPEPAAGWEDAPELDELVQSAGSRFEAVHPQDGWVVKDPRFCLTLPFWMRALDLDDAVMVLALRQPELVARSLVTGGVPPAHALAMWERYMTAALRGLVGCRVAVVRYEQLMTEPVATARELAEVLQAAGALTSPERAELAATAVRTGGQQAELANPVADVMHSHHRKLWQLLQGLPSWSEALVVEPPAESATTTELLRALAGVAWWRGQVNQQHAHFGLLLSPPDVPEFA